jgi:hypothetical protein
MTRCISRLIAFPLAVCLFASCSWFDKKPAPRLDPEWRLVPEATVLTEKRQFFLYGRRLDSVTVTVPPSVLMEKGALNSGGRVLSVHFRVSPLAKDSLADGESKGAREIRVRTPDTSVVFVLKVVDEAMPR